MKKIALLITTAFTTLCLQSAMAETQTQTFTTEVFSTEQAAIAAVQSASKDLKGHTVAAAAQCKQVSDLTVQRFRVLPTWTENGSSYQKGYQGEIEVDFSCVPKERGPFWYASVKTM